MLPPRPVHSHLRAGEDDRARHLVLDDVVRLAGKRRLVDLQVRAAQQHAVRGDDGTGLERDDVADDDFSRVDEGYLAGPAHAHLDAAVALRLQGSELELLVVVVRRSHSGDEADGKEDREAVNEAL